MRYEQGHLIQRARRARAQGPKPQVALKQSMHYFFIW